MSSGKHHRGDIGESIGETSGRHRGGVHEGSGEGRGKVLFSKTSQKQPPSVVGVVENWLKMSLAVLYVFSAHVKKLK